VNTINGNFKKRVVMVSAKRFLFLDQTQSANRSSSAIQGFLSTRVLLIFMSEHNIEIVLAVQAYFNYQACTL
jgi:hypothetical protein